MTSVCCYFDQGFFHFFLRWWFSSPGGVLPLIHRLSCVGVVSFYVPPLYPTMFYRADASPFLFVSYSTCSAFFSRIVGVVHGGSGGVCRGEQRGNDPSCSTYGQNSASKK
jgi:hypothetical protein